jgi:hypothetical protein
MNIQLKGVMASFPKLFKPSSFDKTKEPKFSIGILMDKTTCAAEIKKIKDGCTAVLKEKYGDKVPKGFKLCLHDGSEKEDVDGYGPGVMFVNASSKKKVPVVDTDFTPLDEESGKPYGGCIVNVSVRLWVQDNDFGKKVNCALRAVRFIEDGEPFGEKPMDEQSLQDELGDDDAPAPKAKGKPSKPAPDEDLF